MKVVTYLALMLILFLMALACSMRPKETKIRKMLCPYCDTLVCELHIDTKRQIYLDEDNKIIKVSPFDPRPDDQEIIFCPKCGEKLLLKKYEVLLC